MKIDLGPAVKAEVAKQIARKTENKLIMENGKAKSPLGTNYIEHVEPEITVGRLRPVLPALAEGVDPNQRIGAQVAPKVIKIRGTLCFDSAAVPAFAADVRIMVCTNKQQRFMPDLLADTGGQYSNTLLWDGSTGNPAQYKGAQPYYNLLPVNNKAWKVLHDQVVHLRTSTGPVPQPTGNVFLGTQYSKDFEIVLTTADLPAQLKYDGGLGIAYPTNFAPILAIGWTYPNSFIPAGSADFDKIINLQYTVSMIYED
jgi:hypothetical protein